MTCLPRRSLLALLACLASLLTFGAHGEEEPEIDILTGRAVGPAKLPGGALVYSGPGEEMGRLALSPDGKLAAGAGKDGKVRVFDVSTAKVHSTLDVSKDEVHSVTFSADGKSVFCTHEDVVKEWDVESGEEKRKFEGHIGTVASVLVSPDGRRLATTDTSGIRVWDLKTGQKLHLMKGHEVPQEIPTATPLAIDVLAFSADGRILLSEANDETARLWDTVTGKELRTLPNHDGSAAAVALSPDGALGISTRGNRQQWGDIDEGQPTGGRLRVWEVATGNMRHVLYGHRADLTCVCFSADGRYVFSGSHDRTVRQWEVDSGLEFRRFKLVSSPVSIACGPNGKYAATISAGEGLVIWNLSAAPRPAATEIAVKSLDDAWEKLASVSYDDRTAGFAFYMSRPPAEAAADLSRRLQEKKNENTSLEYRKRIDQLDEPNYQLRLNAYDELAQAGAAARGVLLAAMNHPSAEVRVRVLALLNAIGGTADFRAVLAIEILAQLKIPEAKAELTRLAAAGLPCSPHAKSK